MQSFRFVAGIAGSLPAVSVTLAACSNDATAESGGVAAQVALTVQGSVPRVGVDGGERCFELDTDPSTPDQKTLASYTCLAPSDRMHASAASVGDHVAVGGLGTHPRG